MKLFANKKTRLALVAVLILVGAMLVAFPDKMAVILGSNAYLWMGLTGAGFVTAGLIAFRVITGIDPKTATYEGFAVAAFLAIIVIGFNVVLSNFTFVWIFPLAAAVLILYMSVTGLRGPKSGLE